LGGDFFQCAVVKLSYTYFARCKLKKVTTMYGIEKPIVKNIKPSAKPSTAEGVRNNIEWLKKHHREYQG
jgi:hypothetical protein